MLTIDLKKVDELNEICDEIAIITYLQDLVSMDDRQDFELPKGHEGINGKAVVYLWLKSVECSKRFRGLIKSDDFTKSIKVNSVTDDN